MIFWFQLRILTQGTKLHLAIKLFITTSYEMYLVLMMALVTELTVDEVKSATFEASVHKFLQRNSLLKVSHISDFLFRVYFRAQKD